MTPSDGPVHAIPCRVCYADTDGMGLVYYARYLRWFEMGRTEWLRAQGISYREMMDRGVGLPVSEVHCKYMAPIQYDDALTIETRIDPTVRGGLRFNYRILRDPEEEPLAVGHTLHAFVDPDHRVIRPPRWLREKLTPSEQAD